MPCYAVDKAFGMGKGELVHLQDSMADVARWQFARASQAACHRNRPGSSAANAWPHDRGTLCPRVQLSSADQKADLERQLGRLADYASRERLIVVRSVSGIGSDLNGHRAKIRGLLADSSVYTVSMEHGAPRPSRPLPLRIHRSRDARRSCRGGESVVFIKQDL